MRYFLIILTFFLYNNNVLSKNLFSSEFHTIKFISNNVDEEKINKITEIKFKSIDYIFKEILINKDYNNFKRNLNEDLINYFIKNIIVENEKIINNNYFSEVKINFDKKKIINFLRDNKTSYVEFLPSKFLIIIYESNEFEKNLFSKKNQHYKYLNNNNNYDNFFMIPNLDINDRYLLNENDIDNLDKNKIKKFIDKYDLANSILVTSHLNNSNINYKIYLYSKENLEEISYFTSKEFDYNKLFNEIKSLALEHWKINNQIQNVNINKIICDINYFNILELKHIKHNIDNVSIIESINLKKISYQKNNYYIEYFGNKKLLPKLFTINDLNITIDNEDNCRIQLK